MKYKLLILLCISQVFSISVFAQDHLRIKDIFDKYGKREGSILVQLSTDVLSPKSNISFYKSLIINYSPIVESEITTAVKADIDNKLIISEAKKNGKIESGSYFLGKNKSKEENEFILYRIKDGKITLVFLRGDFSSKKLDHELKKLKDLFIYINNKRLKLQ
ncbi:hypothetical protein [Dysgonomonas sp. Marseille-P4361]|uniref:hypothetical protein n=1 Tax=Dysgonomonas sp. Marseille-P4361 TaxID=2161820 RepID=UPI000D55CD7C|nr:hypothetical protein [Dysgonomonas sp. Marseille-P4361]